MVSSMPPALVSSPSDIVEYRVSDAEPVQGGAPRGFIERYIHSELLKRYAGVNAVVHSHSPIVTAFSISHVPLKPAIHLAGFLGTDVPVFDIVRYYNSIDPQDLLVRNTVLGSDLADQFSDSSSNSSLPDHDVVLMQSHGFATVATDLRTAVFQAIYTQDDASVQSEALQINAAYRASVDAGLNPPAYLNSRQASDSWATDRGTVDKPWDLWTREVSVSPLYVNSLGG